MRAKQTNPDEAERTTADRAAAPNASDDQTLLSAQNRILAKLAGGCSIPELVSHVADYLAQHASCWGTAVHLVDRASGTLTNGHSKILGRALLRDLETLPLTAAWPVGASFANGSPWRRTNETWDDAYEALTRQHHVECTWVGPARSSKGSVVAIVTAFRPRHDDDGAAPTSAPDTGSVLDIAVSILGLGIERIRTVERLRLTQSTVDSSREPFVCAREDGSFFYVNDAACNTFGYSRTELLDKRVRELDANVDEADYARIWDLAKRRGALKVVTEAKRRDGNVIPVEIAISYVEVDGEGFQSATIHNISALRETERKLQECEERYALTARAASDGLWSWDLADDAMRFSPRWCELLGLGGDELHAEPEEWWRRVHPDDLERVRAELEAHLTGDAEAFESEHRMVHTEGRYLWVRCRGEAVRDDAGTATRIAGSLTDITKQKLAEDRLRHDALHDDLTGLPNRSMFMQHLGRTLTRARRSKASFTFAVLFLDFDRFKRINDSLGHLVGDELLVAIARRLGSCIRPNDTVARLGGDEFAILLEPVADVTGATRAAERIHTALRDPFRVSGLEVFITASVGIAIGSSSYERPEDLLRDADTAMYRAKAAGKARHEVFDEGMHARAIEQLKLESELRRAVKRDELCLLYQPVVSIPDRRQTGVEAFARWRHPTKGLLPPSAFLQVAEDSGLIVEIGWWILTEACRQMREWQERFEWPNDVAIHVNLSGKQLFQSELAERIEATLAETGLRPQQLVLDIPENVIMHKAESSVTILSQLKSLGLSIHLDDFGTGYSSLGYLHRFQIDTLKIDNSFIRHLRAGGENWRTVRAIVSLARNLGMDVIAEGVENDEQLEELEKLDCTRAQGSLFAEPRAKEDFENLLAETR